MTCGDCLYFSEAEKPDFMGKCHAPYPVLLLPWSMKQGAFMSRMPVNPDDGEGCPVAIPNTERGGHDLL